MNKLKNISTPELIDELIRRNALYQIDCGIYRNWELRRKYNLSDTKLPNVYSVFVDKSVIDHIYKWELKDD